MPLFKRREKVAADAYWAEYLDFLMSSDASESWESWRAALHDDTLAAISPDLLYLHIRAMLIEIADIAISRRHDGRKQIGALIRSSNARKAAIAAAAPQLAEVADDYNLAFGSSAEDGVAAMVMSFDAAVAPGKLANTTLESLHGMLYESLRERFEDWEKLELE